MNFAPYQSSPPESQRPPSFSPPRSNTASPAGGLPQQHQQKPILSPRLSQAPPSRASVEDPWAAVRGNSLPSPSAFVERGYDDIEARGGFARGGGMGRGRGEVDGDGAYVFETSLGIRMDVEAALAYLLVPPVGGVALLLFEHQSDYVRFHAWQSSLVFTAVFVLHLLLSWSSFLSWVLFIGDLGLIAWLVFRAYTDAETLDRLELPFFGPLASRFVDQE